MYSIYIDLNEQSINKKLELKNAQASILLRVQFPILYYNLFQVELMNKVFISTTKPTHKKYNSIIIFKIIFFL